MTTDLPASGERSVHLIAVRVLRYHNVLVRLELAYDVCLLTQSQFHV